MKQKYYTNIRNIYIYIVIFIVFVVSVIYYASKIRLVTYKDTSENKLYTEQMVKNFDTELSLGLGIYNQVLQSPSVKTFLNTDHNYRNFIEVMEELQSLGGSFNGSNMTIAIGKTTSETVITPKCTKHLSDFFASDLGISETEGKNLFTTISQKKFSYQNPISGITDTNKNILT